MIFPLLLALPTLLVIASVASAWLSPDTATINHLLQHVLPRALPNTLALVAGVAVLTCLIGVCLAWLTAVYEFPGRRFFVWALLLPMAIPGYVMAFAFAGLFEYTGPLQSGLRRLFGTSDWFPDIYSFGGVTLVMSLVLYPYVYLIVRNAFQTQGRRSLEIGQSLGLSSRKSFFLVSLPLARPWIAGGVLLVVMETLADFGTVATFNYDTLTTAIYQSWFSLYSLQGALQIASILVTFSLLTILLERRTRAGKSYAQPRSEQLAGSRLQLKGIRGWQATAFCSFVFLLAFVLPLLRLLSWARPNIALELSGSFAQYVAGSLSVALSATAMITLLALLLAYANRLDRNAVTGAAVRVSTLGYAVPGTVLAIGLYLPITKLNQSLESAGFTDNLLQGTFLVMLLGLSVRFMAVAFSPIENNLLRVTPTIDDACRSLGTTGLSMLRRIHLPIIRGGMITAMTLVFVDVMKELPITLMTRPFGFNTLAVRVFELSSEGLWQRAALPALAIMLVGLIPIVLLLTRTDPMTQTTADVGDS